MWQVATVLGRPLSQKKCNMHFLITIGIVSDFFMKVEMYIFMFSTVVYKGGFL